MITQLGFGFGVFLGSLGLGWWSHRRGWLTERATARLMRVIVSGGSPIALCLSFWQMDLHHLEPWLLPLLGVLIACSTLLPAFLYARRAALSPPQTGSFLTCAFFSNLGYLGAWTAFALFGEQGYALCMLYLVFFNPCFYTLGFAIAARYGQATPRAGIETGSKTELRFYPFLGMLLGIALNLLHVARPSILGSINRVLIPLNTGLYLVAIGSQLTLSSLHPWLGPCVAMSAIKFLYTPLIAWGLVLLCHLHGLPRSIVLLEAATPVAVSPLIFPLLFGLDRDLSNALWLFTTLLAIPWLLLYLQWLI